MKHIEDADEQKEFDKAVHAFNDEKNHFKTWREECAFFFIAGRESMAKEFWTAKPKRTVQAVIKAYNSNLYVLSTDGKVFCLSTGGILTDNMKWIKLPDLPQED